MVLENTRTHTSGVAHDSQLGFELLWRVGLSQPSITGAQVTRNTGNTHNTGNTTQAKHSTTRDRTQIMQQKQHRQRIYETQTTLYQATLVTQIITGKKNKRRKTQATYMTA